ncbi:hypothetical protein CONLIGDRAFT_694086 [Coniochaeta ligniaria NRRL 30616]|uniref:Uncharacterized protein n=1 Tax=Coniochaeta ligniaria NRRL 30616 TaxID=1408157 RepID=A0A1J7J1U8_9PEZI|nr:hypothetical protein CONLIGDRAFT_694086 [Coniochaeta ligniaria NRRL 30616]
MQKHLLNITTQMDVEATLYDNKIDMMDRHVEYQDRFNLIEERIHGIEAAQTPTATMEEIRADLNRLKQDIYNPDTLAENVKKATRTGPPMPRPSGAWLRTATRRYRTGAARLTRRVLQAYRGRKHGLNTSSKRLWASSTTERRRMVQKRWTRTMTRTRKPESDVVPFDSKTSYLGNSLLPLEFPLPSLESSAPILSPAGAAALP